MEGKFLIVQIFKEFWKLSLLTLFHTEVQFLHLTLYASVIAQDSWSLRLTNFSREVIILTSVCFLFPNIPPPLWLWTIFYIFSVLFFCIFISSLFYFFILSSVPHCQNVFCDCLYNYIQCLRGLGMIKEKDMPTGGSNTRLTLLGGAWTGLHAREVCHSMRLSRD